ncbi:response regulator transcription factor [Pseudoteredinibacter isoporae]|uniref:Two-component system response regulator DesR n=1 Tax=Pseudoteredinibacter isoporae TaxID=570281 RepID=A0A7X0JWV3_9GAMM|nr:response regulator transcription factor [Pseudoteredinibacter isoporae]MBB6523687.1 two-component system response regulator DesR [Pseudoteredinibacter isoporae]NHO89190.1 response regulator transcription factor [Pseudoteredinibacter isoporae]NIB22199.1 response regulator transcription factor [Pseudoteredinibacter isoporae]
MTKVLIVEDQALVRGAISALLQLEEGLEVIGQAEDGVQALEMIKAEQPDLVLSDIEMPNMTGLELVEKIRQDYPAVKTAIMTTFSRAGYIRRAIEAGVGGFILKEAPSDSLLAAIQQIMQGKTVIDPELALSALGDNDPLTDKERKALRLAGEGLKTSEIAGKLFLSEGTVRNYLSEAIAKLNASNRIDAARIAKQKGWL